MQGPAPPIYIRLHKTARRKTSLEMVKPGQEELRATLHPENISLLTGTVEERTQDTNGMGEAASTRRVHMVMGHILPFT
jgi:hypothetical protein